MEANEDGKKKQIAENLCDLYIHPQDNRGQRKGVVMSDPSRAELLRILEETLFNEYEFFESHNGHTYARNATHPNAPALPIKSRAHRRKIRKAAGSCSINLTPREEDQLISNMEAEALSKGEYREVFTRVAPIENGVEIDIGDAADTRIRITPGKVELVFSSDTLMTRSPSMRPLPIPSAVGDYKLLRKYVNLAESDWLLLLVWMIFTICHPKVPSTNYVILVLLGDQGSGKTWLVNSVIQALLDPGVGLRSFPNKKSDLAIAAQHGHLLTFDNARYFNASMSDLLCLCATGGSLGTRQLYTDTDQSVVNLHAPIAITTIHSCISQPDLAQRCLSLGLRALDGKERKSETELNAQLGQELPVIYSGLLNLCAEVMVRLPEAKVSSPERMLDFCRWIAAFELVREIPQGRLQSNYSYNLVQTLHDSLTENTLAVAVMRLAEAERSWSGTPEALLNEITQRYGFELARSRDWPPNAIAMSKRLRALSAGLRTQHVEIAFCRGKERQITVTSISA